MEDREALLERWKELYQRQLPQAAKQHKDWPVQLDHCFARIILDNTVGQGSQPWHSVIKKPAIKHLSTKQLVDAVSMAESILKGNISLTELDEQSLRARGKLSKLKSAKKRKASPADTEDDSRKGGQMPVAKKTRRGK